MVWLGQSPEPGLAGPAEEVAAMFGLPLTVVDVGTAAGCHLLPDVARRRETGERIVVGPHGTKIERALPCAVALLHSVRRDQNGV